MNGIFTNNMGLIAGVILVYAAASLSSQSCIAAEDRPTVGMVSLILGEATKVSSGGERGDVSRGMFISVGDKIETRSNGHVHIRFIDDALVSVRPNSKLIVDSYEFDEVRPERSAIKFSLLEGVTRAISGEAAKTARDRFRLNTPVAAIGVRGTDFVVGVTGETTRAQVNEGAIVLAPFSDACSVDTFGPCMANALELDGNTLQLAVLAADESVPRILPPQLVRQPDFMQQEVKSALSSVSSSSSMEGSQARPAVSESTSSASAQQSESSQVLLESTTNPVIQTAEIIAAKPSDDDSFQSVAEQNFTPPVPLTVADLEERQLVWGYYAESPLASNRIALSRNQAAVGRSISVGSTSYGLYRADAEDGTRAVNKELAIVGFQLSSAQAVYNSGTGIVAMMVRDGNLDINFQDRTFTTALNLEHELTGEVGFAASGQLFDGGFFRAIEATQKVSGAVSFDGTEAGYLFERQLENGLVSGLTLWGTQ